MILSCTCVSEGQDKLHGKGQRVHNEHKDKTGQTSYRCTVCLKERKAK